jgi:carbamoyl-phosphate synthase large subunit
MPTNNNQIVLVTGVGGPAGINAVRLLKAIPGTRVIGCDIDELSAGRFFVDEFLIAPRVTDREAYVSWVTKTVAEYGISLCVPTVHEELPLMADLALSLPCPVLISRPEAIAFGEDKHRLYQWATTELAAHAIPAVLLSDWTSQWLADDMQFIKPRQGRGGRGCQKMTKTELVALQASTTTPDEYIVMEYMPGTEWTVDAYQGKDGTMVYVVPRERIGLAGGISIKGRTVRNETLITLSTEVCQAIGFYGPVCLQWRADAAGTPRLIEINPRLSGGLPITVAAGVNPIVAVLSEIRGEVAQPQSWEEVTVIGHFEYKKL